MKTYHCLLILATAWVVAPVKAQETANPPPPAGQPATGGAGGYSSDLQVVSQAQQQALAQARQMLAQGGNSGGHAALQIAVTEMERAQAALESAKSSPDKLPAAIAAEQAAYQALLKATPREFRMSRSQNSGRNRGDSAGEPGQRESDQLDLQQEQNRYETERQAQDPANATQREQTQVANRLKQLAQRQQDLNDRVRELQTALQAARTDQERADIQNQLKRLDDEQRQMLASVDDLRQQLQQSPNVSEETGARQQLDQTRTDMQRASEDLQNHSPSEALAAGTRAQQGMQNLGEDLRRQTSTQFSEQMRQLRNEARDMENREKEIARGLDSLNHGQHQTLDDSEQRDQISRQMAEQEGALTNLLAGMKDVTEQAETTEPLLSKQLNDTLRRADQMHTDNLLDMGSQLVDRGFLPQASETESVTRTNITELADRVTRAADSVLGSRTEALRYAQTELDDLSRQLQREIGGATNIAGNALGGMSSAGDLSNRLARAEGRTSVKNGAGMIGANAAPDSTPSASPGETQMAGNNPPARQASTENQQNAENQGEAAAGNDGRPGQASGGNPTENSNPPNPRPESTPSQSATQNEESASATGGANGGGGNAERFRRIAESLGQGNGTAAQGGPITGNDYSTWSQQLRDVENVLESPDLQNQLATVRDRLGAFRAQYRNSRRPPSAETIREQLLMPLSQVQVWVQEELARQENSASRVPLDRDPVPQNYSDLVKKYYEKLGNAP